jgi:NitT/TauT family transport system substrate-binding protein
VLESRRRQLGANIAALILAGATATAAAAQEKVVIAHGSQQIELTHPGLYLGEVLGFYEEEGIDIDVQLTEGSQQALQLLAAGQVQFITVTTTTILNAREQGVNARIVYSEVSHDNNVVATLAGGEYDSVEDLKGTDVGVFSMTSGGVPYLKAVLGENGVKAEDVNMVPLGAGAAALEGLKDGTVSALSLWAGAIAVFENQGAELTLFKAEALDRAPGFVLATTDSYIEENPEIVEKVGRIFAKAHVFAMTIPEATVRAYWEAVPGNKPAEVTDQTVAEQAHILEVGLRDMRVDNRADTRFGWNDPEGIDILQDYLIENGARTVKLPVADLHTNDFVDAYNDFDVEAIKKMATEYKP